MSGAPDRPAVVTLAKAARILGVDVGEVRSLVARGDLKATRRGREPFVMTVVARDHLAAYQATVQR